MRIPVVRVIAVALMALIPMNVDAQSYSYVAQWGTAGTGAGQFSYPMDIGADPDGRIHVIDWAGRGQTFTSDGAFLESWGSGAGAGSLTHPIGMWTGASALFVADGGDGMIHEFDVHGLPMNSWRLSPYSVVAGGSGPNPLDVAVTADGDFYVAFGSFFGGGVVSFSYDGNPRADWDVSALTPQSLEGASSLALSEDGLLYVADVRRNRILVLSRSGSYVTEWGSQGGEAGQFQGPCGLAIDREGSVYVADSRNDRVQKFTGTGTFLTSFGFHGAGEGQFDRPVGVAVDGEGAVYVVDQRNHRVQKFEAAASTPAVSGTWGAIKRRYGTVAR